MKVSTIHRPRRGFTLIELLVVITIIAVLAGAGFAIGSAALNRARQVSAQATATSIDQAVNLFFSEYGTFPISGEGTSRVVTDSSSTTFLQALIGQEDTLNPRGIRFLTVKEGTGNRNGIIFNAGNSPTGVYDPWGNPYTVRMDTSYQDRLTFNIDITPFQGNTSVTLNGRRVAVYSPGVPEGDRSSLSDMVKTW